MSKESTYNSGSNKCHSFDFSDSSFGSVHPNYFGTLQASFQPTKTTYSTPTIQKISLKWGTFIDYISITFSDNSQKSFGSSTGGYDSAEISLLTNGDDDDDDDNDDEYIVKVSGYQREAVLQLTFETNGGRVYGPFGSSKLNGAYPFASSGCCLKDLHVSEGKVCPTFLVKFLVVVGICPEWTTLPSMERFVAECRREVVNAKEGIEIIAKAMPLVGSDEVDVNKKSTSKSTGVVNSKTSEYEDTLLEIRRSLDRCYKLLQKTRPQGVNLRKDSESTNSETENTSTTYSVPTFTVSEDGSWTSATKMYNSIYQAFFTFKSSESFVKDRKETPQLMMSTFDLAEQEQTLTVMSDGEESDNEESDDEETELVTTSVQLYLPAASSSVEKIDTINDEIMEQVITKQEEIEKMNLNRKNLLNEFLSTEEYYVEGLKILNYIFRKQIEARNIVDPKILKTIFQDLEIVCNVNRSFLQELRIIFQKQRELNDDLQEKELQQNFKAFGELLNTYAHTFKLYSTYIGGYKKAVQVLSDEKKKNKELCNVLNFIKNLLKDQGERMINIESYLVTPVQRIPRYKLLLEALVKNTQQDDASRPKLEEALSLIKDIALYVNEAETKIENIQITLHMAHKLRLKGFISPSRYIIDFWSEENKSTSFIQCKSGYYILKCELYIFNDILVLHKNYDSLIYSKVDLLYIKPGAKQGTSQLVKKVSISTNNDNNEVTLVWQYLDVIPTSELTFITTTPTECLRLETAFKKVI